MKASSDYLNQSPRTLAEVEAARLPQGPLAMGTLGQALAAKPWLSWKISFDPWLPGTAKLKRIGRKRPTKIAGQWVVFDRSANPQGYAHGNTTVLFAADTTEECSAFIDRAAGYR